MNENKMQKYADKYFLRANEILKKDNLNPWVNMQVFVRKGPGKIAGINEAIDLIVNNSNIENVGGRIYAKRENDNYNPTETIMNIIAPVQEIMELETLYLGVIAAATMRKNDKKDINLKEIQKNVLDVKKLIGDRPILYFGARHWHYNMDKEISEAAFLGGATDCSTDNGAELIGKKGLGTIPHALENIYAYYHGLENAVVEATKAFDKHIDKNVPRIALVDYANKEITDSINTKKALYGNLQGVRVDTCGENIAEGGIKGDKKYWEGTGVTVQGVAVLRHELDKEKNGNKVGIVLSSGFGNTDKIRAFNDGEKYFGCKLYDAIGAGFLDNVRTSTADIITVGNEPDQVDYFARGIDSQNIIHKVGRPPKYNVNLERML